MQGVSFISGFRVSLGLPVTQIYTAAAPSRIAGSKGCHSTQQLHEGTAKCYWPFTLKGLVPWQSDGILLHVLGSLRQHAITWIGKTRTGKSLASKTIVLPILIRDQRSGRDDLIPTIVTAKHLDFFKAEPLSKSKPGRLWGISGFVGFRVYRVWGRMCIVSRVVIPTRSFSTSQRVVSQGLRACGMRL